MPEEKVRVLKEGLPSLHDMETDDLVDYLLRARQIFVTSLTKKNPPLDERSLLLETANFDEAVRRILSEKSSAADTSGETTDIVDDRPEVEESSGVDGASHVASRAIDLDEPETVSSENSFSDVSLDSYLSERDQEDEDVLLLEEKPLFAEQPLLEKLTRPRTSSSSSSGVPAESGALRDAGSSGTSSNREEVSRTRPGSTDIGMEQGGIDLDDFSPMDERERREKDRRTEHRVGQGAKSPKRDKDIDLHDEDRDPSPYVWDSDVDERSGGGFLGFISGLIVLAVYITLPALALVSPLLTPAMAWEEWINLSILSGIVVVAVLICALFSRYRFRYALYGGMAFALLSSGAHYIPQVRDFVENEKIVLPMASHYLIEGYFQLAEESQLPLKTGAVQLQPNELNYSRLQRVNLFVKEVDAWLEN
ncbi:hypothetical protein [uncultured Kiloniella sp.]|uniref:hypothetical protein n=1 Tax=uncultured Kiloniella sp. TaxID=1133091 RepID=UPI00260AEEEA|nr:hypothetical protein [uncultured Kiloniella sp.]